jgi:magnesium-transporting ATPase (P-type)
MKLFKKVIPRITVLILGIFSGAMTLIALALVRYWNTLSPENYRQSFQTVGDFLGAVMIPLMLLSIVCTLICTIIFKENRKRWLFAFILVALIIPLYAFAHGPINDQILGNLPLSTEAISDLRQKWVLYHWVRTLLGLGAFGCCVRTL